jgi:hypothetical protein
MGIAQTSRLSMVIGFAIHLHLPAEQNANPFV